MAQDVKFERGGSVFVYKIFEAKEDKLGHPHVYPINAHENYKNCYTALSWIFSPKCVLSFVSSRSHDTQQ